ncbi:MAG: hypothetical protein J6B12_02090 [Clostridia bacterium]|nr:hypothetical protein [Clostridia bacterium]
MKKTLALLLALLLLLCGCTNLPEDTDNTDSTDSTEPNIETTKPLETSNANEISYEDIERRAAISYKTGYYGFQNDGALLNIAYPTEWSLSQVDEGFDVLRDGEIIGYMLGAPADDMAAWTELLAESHTQRGVRITKHIDQRNGKAEFRYRYVYRYPSDGRMRTVTLTAACQEIDQTSEEKLFTSAFTLDKVTSETLGALTYYLGEPSSILILGNSFIGTSNIGNVLKEMISLGGKSCNVRAISRGYARVGTYTGDEALMQSIRDGAYEAVFICGFYAVDEVKNLGILRDACEESLTELIIFPAHNENASAIAAAKAEHSDLLCLDWKAEINALIEGGVDLWDMCINDQHKHSTPLAGYVGAHMIYRAIYEEMPLAPMKSTLTQSYIDSILGDYAYVGDSVSIAEEKITYLD